MGLFGGGLGETIRGILGGAGDTAKDIREAIKGKELDPNIAAELTQKANKLEADLLWLVQNIEQQLERGEHVRLSV